MINTILQHLLGIHIQAIDWDTLKLVLVPVQRISLLLFVLLSRTNDFIPQIIAIDIKVYRSGILLLSIILGRQWRKLWREGGTVPSRVMTEEQQC